MDEWRMPPNPAAPAMAEALAVAWRCSQSDARALVLVVVQPGERNLYDQQWLVQELWEGHGVKALRRTLAEVQQRAELRGDSNQLWMYERASVLAASIALLSLATLLSGATLDSSCARPLCLLPYLCEGRRHSRHRG